MLTIKIEWRIVIGGVVGIALIVLGFWYFTRPLPLLNYPSKGTDIIAFGDSLVEGVGSADGLNFVEQLSGKIGERIINLGHAGDTTSDGLARINQLDVYHPQVVLLLLGGNDYLKKIPIEDTKKNLADIIQNIQARGAIVLLLGVRGGVLKDNFDSMFTNLRDTYRTAYVSDVLSGLLENPRRMTDAVHPNNAGYTIIANRIYPVLTGLIDK